MSPRGVFVDQLCIICNIFEISRLMLLKKLPSHNNAPFGISFKGTDHHALFSGYLALLTI